ncbi:MAG: type I DNA topoisomerase [Gracilibacteraceae bacterium]|jgi:DNA topoisomerase-1|nr:type I DNA topoisomerase [Gracilibacteraceae bacterium]
MAKTLVIVESPAKAKSIGKFLSRNYVVKASMGHLRDLPKSQIGVDVEHDFEPKYIPIRGRGPLVKELRAAAKGVDNVLLASDPDREGEAIAWHLMHLLELDLQAASRVEFHEITKSTVQKAVKSPRRLDFNKVDAQQARRVLDRLVGYKLSPLLWHKIKRGLSAGRVQSVAVRLICDREDEIRRFVPAEYWTLEALLRSAGGEFTAKLLQENGKKLNIGSQAEMARVLGALTGAVFAVQDIRTREKRKQPAPPFTTSSLQQEAYRKLGFSPKKTMIVAQQLYEGLDTGQDGTVGLITYMRTDAVRVSAEAQQEARDYIKTVFGAPFVPGKPRQYTAKGRAQEAHEAVRPTAVPRRPDDMKPYLSREQLRLYRLIWERFLASQMSDAVFDTVAVDVTAAAFLFRANAQTVKFPGYLSVYEESRDENEEEPGALKVSLTKGETLTLQKLTDKQHFTEPPPRYTEASLVRKLEEGGIGRPSTYAPIIETIQARGYVVREEKKLLPTELGEVVVALLKDKFTDVVDPEFTAGMEARLDEVEEGRLPWKDVIRDFYGDFAAELAKAEESVGRIEVRDPETEEICELCGRHMVIKMGRYGKFLACPGFPDCRNIRSLLEDAGVACPKCGANVVVRRSKKGRRFYGCSAWPNCDFVSWEKPTGETCPRCGGFMVEKQSRQGVRHSCANKECRYSVIVKDA